MHGRLWAASKLGLIIAIALLAGGQQSARGEEHAATQMAGSCTPAAFRVLVDVGHTLAVPGANSARGVPEYAFNLQLARDVKQALVAAGFEQTVLLITATRSEEHTSELQSRRDLVCRLLLEKKKSVDQGVPGH